MPKGLKGFQPGQSGNPKGRPKKERALTALLQKVGQQRIDLPDGSRKSKAELVCTFLWEVAVYGVTTLVERDGEQPVKIRPDAGEWGLLVKFLWSQIDGPPPRDVDITSGGQPIAGPVVYLPEVDPLPDSEESDQDGE